MSAPPPKHRTPKRKLGKKNRKVKTTCTKSEETTSTSRGASNLDSRDSCKENVGIDTRHRAQSRSPQDHSPRLPLSTVSQNSTRIEQTIPTLSPHRPVHSIPTLSPHYPVHSLPTLSPLRPIPPLLPPSSPSPHPPASSGGHLSPPTKDGVIATTVSKSPTTLCSHKLTTPPPKPPPPFPLFSNAGYPSGATPYGSLMAHPDARPYRMPNEPLGSLPGTVHPLSPPTFLAIRPVLEQVTFDAQGRPLAFPPGATPSYPFRILSRHHSM